MLMEWPVLIEGGIPILGGILATALGYGAIRIGSIPPAPFKERLLARLRWLGPLVVLFGLFTAWQTHQQLARPSAESIAREIAARVQFPKQIDEVTSFVGVEGIGDSLIYSFAISTPLANLGGKESVQSQMNAHWLQMACVNPDSQKILLAGYTLQARYSFQGTAEQVAVTVPPATCSPQGS